MKLQTPRLSVVVPTHNRRESLRRLLRQLDEQTLDVSDYEVRVVDDGSSEAVSLEGLGLRGNVFVERQENRGAAAARHAGALAARGDVLVFVDDDMQVPPSFLQEHLRLHAAHERCVVVGRIRPDPAARMPLFERWHAAMLDKMSARFEQGESVRGMHLFTGNASVRRADYLAVGGFDLSLPHSEDAELGLRLELAGCHFVFGADATVLHASDHVDPAAFLKRARTYGEVDARIARKHADVAEANPWRFLFALNPLLRPVIATGALAPSLASAVARSSLKCAEVCDRIGLSRLALLGTTASFAAQYFSGVRADAKHAGLAVRGAARFKLLGSARGRALIAFARAVRADHQTTLRNEGKYGHRAPSDGSLAKDLVQRIGLQELFALRLARLFNDAGLQGLAKVTTRLCRHLYGSDVHWEAALSPGLMLVHGFGLAVSHEAKIGPGCVLFQNVTLGMGTDPLTRNVGAPTLEANVSVGPGATLLGPITIGANTKIGPGAVVTRSIPAGSVVEAGSTELNVRARGERHGVAAALGAGDESGARG